MKRASLPTCLAVSFQPIATRSARSVLTPSGTTRVDDPSSELLRPDRAPCSASRCRRLPNNYKIGTARRACHCLNRRSSDERHSILVIAARNALKPLASVCKLRRHQIDIHTSPSRIPSRYWRRSVSADSPISLSCTCLQALRQDARSPPACIRLHVHHDGCVTHEALTKLLLFQFNLGANAQRPIDLSQVSTGLRQS